MKNLLRPLLFISFMFLSVSTSFALDPQSNSQVTSAAKEGLEPALSPAQLQAQAQQYESNKNQLRDLLRGVRSLLTPKAARDQLRSSIELIVQSGNSGGKETFIHYSLNRAMKLSDLLGQAGQNSFIEDLQKRILWTSSESALKLADSDMAKAAEFGITNTEFILSWSDSILNSSAQYKIATLALVFLQNDLNRDSERLSFGREITAIDTYLSSQKTGRGKDSDYARAMPALRAAYANVLGDLKALPRFTNLIDDPTNPGLDYYRRTLRENLSDPDLDTRLHAMKSLETLELKPNDEIKLAQMLGDSSYQVCSEAMDIFKPILQLAPGTESALYTSISQQSIRECKDAAIILLGRVHTSEAKGYLSNLYHSTCIGSDVSMIVNYSVALSSQPAGPDLLSQSGGLCIGSLCVGDWVAARVRNEGLQGAISAIDHGKVMIGQTGMWMNPHDVGRKVDCIPGICTGESGMLKETSGHKGGQMFKRLAMGMTPVGILTGYNADTEIAIYHTFLEVSAVFDNGLVLVSEENHGGLASWTTADKFEKISDAFDQQKKCYVPVQ